MTLGQGHQKVIEYISPGPYILCAKYLAEADAVEMNWKHKVTPDWGDLITVLVTFILWGLIYANMYYFRSDK